MAINITPTVFKSGFFSPSAAGDVAGWAPAAGKKFRLLRYILEFPYGNAILTGGKLFTVFLKDGATTIAGLTTTLWIPASVGGLGAYVVDRDLGNGYLSLAVDNVLSLNVDGALNQTATNGFRIVAMGTEE